MEYKKSQQMWLFLLALIPGVLTYFKLISPIQAALLVMLAYVLSRRHANELQRRYQLKMAQEIADLKKEEEKYASLPSKKRKNIQKGLAKRTGATDIEPTDGGVEE